MRMPDFSVAPAIATRLQEIAALGNELLTLASFDALTASLTSDQRRVVFTHLDPGIQWGMWATLRHDRNASPDRWVGSA